MDMGGKKIVQWNLSWQTTAMRDHLSWQTTHFWQKDLHFNITEPATRDHLSWQTTFLWLMGWPFKTGSTVYYMTQVQNVYHLAWQYFILLPWLLLQLPLLVCKEWMWVDETKVIVNHVNWYSIVYIWLRFKKIIIWFGKILSCTMHMMCTWCTLSVFFFNQTCFLYCVSHVYPQYVAY